MNTWDTLRYTQSLRLHGSVCALTCAACQLYCIQTGVCVCLSTSRPINSLYHRWTPVKQKHHQWKQEAPELNFWCLNKGFKYSCTWYSLVLYFSWIGKKKTKQKTPMHFLFMLPLWSIVSRILRERKIMWCIFLSKTFAWWISELVCDITRRGSPTCLLLQWQYNNVQYAQYDKIIIIADIYLMRLFPSYFPAKLIYVLHYLHECFKLKQQKHQQKRSCLWPVNLLNLRIILIRYSIISTCRIKRTQ